ncbi:hypothetical protein Bca52824_016364 [Brassica carinata]|uniref:GYF domain-containing protein n=1 Tax=Brassica carinata TaxID=52824 RepID=A0A8X7W3V3_BRACI|nr:hypothetical protein Bca52824_016364 [Brassica carinata]
MAQELINELSQRLEKRGLDVKIIFSGGMDLDILPQGPCEENGFEGLTSRDVSSMAKTSRPIGRSAITDIHTEEEGSGWSFVEAEPPTKKQKKVNTSEGQAGATGKGSNEEPSKELLNNATMESIVSVVGKMIGSRFKPTGLTRIRLEDIVKYTLEESESSGVGKRSENIDNLSIASGEEGSWRSHRAAGQTSKANATPVKTSNVDFVIVSPAKIWALLADGIILLVLKTRLVKVMDFRSSRAVAPPELFPRIAPKISRASPAVVLQPVFKPNESDKVWHYKDPSGKVQGPFSMVQLHKWNNTGYFPAKLEIWSTNPA